MCHYIQVASGSEIWLNPVYVDIQAPVQSVVLICEQLDAGTNLYVTTNSD